MSNQTFFMELTHGPSSRLMAKDYKPFTFSASAASGGQTL